MLALLLLAQTVIYHPAIRPVAPLTSRVQILCLGDSKTTDTTWQVLLRNSVEAQYRTTLLGMTSVGTAGVTAADRAGTIAADLAAISTTMDAVLVNLGANDVAALPAEATWKADMGTIVDALHAKWPNAAVYLTRVWRSGEAADCNSLATWMADLVTLKGTWLKLGDDERVWLEGGDNGATMSSDGVHYTAAGKIAAAAARKTALGY